MGRLGHPLSDSVSPRMMEDCLLRWRRCGFERRTIASSSPQIINWFRRVPYGGREVACASARSAVVYLHLLRNVVGLLQNGLR